MATVKLIPGIINFHRDAAGFAIIVRIFPIFYCKSKENRSYYNASINVKPEGGPRAHVGHLTFHKNFRSKSLPWGPNIWSNQIKYPHHGEGISLKFIVVVVYILQIIDVLKLPSFLINSFDTLCNPRKMINKSSIKSKRPHPGTQILTQIPEGGEGNRGQMPHMCLGLPPPPLGLNIDRCLSLFKSGVWASTGALQGS